MNGLKEGLKHFFYMFVNRNLDEINIDNDNLDDEENKKVYLQGMIDSIEGSNEAIKQIIPEYENTTKILSNYQKIALLPQEYKESIYQLALEIHNVKNEKIQYEDIMSTNEDKIYFFEPFKDKMDEIIKKIHEYEERYNVLKRDLNHLEAEKAELSYKKDKMLNKRYMLKIMTIVFFALFSFTAIILITLLTIYKKNVIIPSVILLSSAIFYILYLSTNKKKISYRLKRTDKLLKKAVQLLNKVKIKIVNTRQYLDYEYKRFKVDSYVELKYLWEQYKIQEDKKSKLKKANNQINIYEQELIDFLESKGIEDIEQLLLGVDILINEEELNDFINHLEETRNNLKHQIDSCRKSSESDINKLKVFIENNDEEDDMQKVIEELLH